MPWTDFTDDRGRRSRIDQLGLWILCRQHVYHQLIHQRSRVVRETHFFGPDLVTVETDFRGIAQARNQLSTPLYARLERESIRDAARTQATLVHMRQEIDHWVRSLQAMQRSASRETTGNIDQSVRRGEIGLQAATTVRDLSATTLVVGSTFLTGGAAVAVLGGGSALRGVARYQDHGNIGSAILEASGTFIVGVIPLGAAATAEGQVAQTAVTMTSRVTAAGTTTAGQRAVVVVVGASMDASFEGMKAVVEGQSTAQALRAASARFGVDVLSGGMGARLDNLAFPVVARLTTDTLLSAGGDALVSSAAGGPRPPGGAAAPPRALPQPSSPICDANATLITGNCGAQDWVRQLVLQTL